MAASSKTVDQLLAVLAVHVTDAAARLRLCRDLEAEVGGNASVRATLRSLRAAAEREAPGEAPGGGAGADAVRDGPGDVAGLRVSLVRRMTQAEMEAEGWDGWRAPASRPPALVLEGGAVIYPSRDPEGNGPGALFGYKGVERFLLIGG